jgi:cytochrome c oxidase assembly factor CtaG
VTHLPFALHPFEMMFGVAVVASAVRGSTVATARLVGGVLWLAVTLWPVGDIAASHSLSVATGQRLVIMLACVPLILRTVPVSTLVRITRPRYVDVVASWLARPLPALGVVTVGGTLTLSSPLVNAAATNEWWRIVVLVITIVCGVVLWLPVLGLIPGARHLSPAAQAGYLFAASLVVTVMSFVWIFSLHPLYPALTLQPEIVHLSALADQQLAGFVAKLGAFLPLWTVAFIIFFRSDSDDAAVEQSPLRWADVERLLLRTERREQRQRRRPAD